MAEGWTVEASAYFHGIKHQIPLSTGRDEGDQHFAKLSFTCVHFHACPSGAGRPPVGTSEGHELGCSAQLEGPAGPERRPTHTQHGPGPAGSGDARLGGRGWGEGQTPTPNPSYRAGGRPALGRQTQDENQEAPCPDTATAPQACRGRRRTRPLLLTDAGRLLPGAWTQAPEQLRVRGELRAPSTEGEGSAHLRSVPAHRGGHAGRRGPRRAPQGGFPPRTRASRAGRQGRPEARLPRPHVGTPLAM